MAKTVKIEGSMKNPFAMTKAQFEKAKKQKAKAGAKKNGTRK